MSGAWSALTAGLGTAPPEGLRVLTEEQLATLATALEQARVHQGTALTQAIDAGLEIIPKLLRGTVKKVLF